MQAKTDRFYLRLAWAWIIGWTVWRCFYAGAFALVPDEANYWQWSRYLDWGYHDQAPLVAWAIRLSTLLGGHTETAVRLPSVAAMFLASAYMLQIARRWLGAQAAWKVALLTQGILEFNVGGLLATPDGLQAAAWAGASYHVAAAYEKHQGPHWLAAGLWFGLGMLSKYTMVLFLPGAFLYGLLSDRHRPRLASLRPYLGVALGTLMFVPVIVWNARHGWNSVRHVAHLGGTDQGLALHLKFFGDFWASQAALLSPLVFILVLAGWVWVGLQKHPPGQWILPYLFWTSFLMVAGFALLSLHTRVYGNWPGAGYLTAAVLAAACSADTFTGRLPHVSRRLWPWAIGSAYLFTGLVLLQAVWPVLPIPVRLDRASRETSGWRELGQRAVELQEQMPEPHRTFLFGLRYQIASELAFYAPGHPRTVSINRWDRPNVYDYWWKDEDLIGWDAVGVTYDPQSHKTRLEQVFSRVDPPVRLDIRPRTVLGRTVSGVQPLKTFYLYRAYGFTGGLAWLPPDRLDVRAR